METGWGGGFCKIDLMSLYWIYLKTELVLDLSHYEVGQC